MATLTLSGKLVDRLYEGMLTEERETGLREKFDAATYVKIGFGYRKTVELTDEERADVVGYLLTVGDCEEQIAGGAGDGADYGLIRAVRKLRAEEENERHRRMLESATAAGTLNTETGEVT
jgi:hypothetical protein